MTREKRRLTLEELKTLPQKLWWLELAQIVVDARGAGQKEIEQETLDAWLLDPDLTPEKIVELREKLQRATGSTVEETAASDAA